MERMRRVVVTGLGMVTPLACGVDATWRRLVAGESAAARVENFDVSDLPCQIAAQVPRGAAADAFNPDDWMDAKEQRRVDDFIVYGMSAATQALRDAGWAPRTYDEEIETGVLIGSGIGGLGGIYDASVTLHEKGPRRISPFFIPGRLINLVSGQVSIAHNLKGPNHSVVTACSTGAHAIGDAGRLIALGDANVMVAGGAESAVNRLSLAGFCACRALSTGFNDRPKQASRPYDRDRDGFVMGEGAGCVVLEEFEHAKARGAPIYAELIGYGLSGDAYHITRPRPGRRRRVPVDGHGAQAGGPVRRPRSTMSTRTAPRRRSATRSNSRRLSGCSATAPPRRPCRRRNPRSAIFSARREQSRPSSRFLRSATRSRRPRSIWTILRWRRRSILRPTPRASVRSGRRCPIPSALAAPTHRWCSARRTERLTRAISLFRQNPASYRVRPGCGARDGRIQPRARSPPL